MSCFHLCLVSCSLGIRNAYPNTSSRSQTVYKCMKSVLVPGTALFMMWTEDDVKLNPSTVFQGNVRIASLQGTAAGFQVFVFKDNVGRKVRAQDIGTSDLSSKQTVSYPMTYTKLLRYPWTQKQCDLLGITYEHMDDKEKAARTALKRKAVANLALCVYNV
jgi:hypothetical protein